MAVMFCYRFLHCRASRCLASVVLCHATASEYARQTSSSSEVAVVRLLFTRCLLVVSFISVHCERVQQVM